MKNSFNMSVGLSVVGTILVIIGLLLAFVVVPGMKRLPDDVDVVRDFDVAYLTLVDLELFQVPDEEASADEADDTDAADSTDDADADEDEPDSTEAASDDPCSTAGKVFFIFEEGHECPLHIERHVTVEATEGDDALVREVQTIYNGDDVLAGITYHYAVDRRSLESLERGEFPSSWSENEGYFQREGLVFGWGVDSEPRNYVGWADDYLDTVALTFVEETEYAGMDALYFTSESDPEEIDEDYVELLGLPTELPIDLLPMLAEGLEFENEQLATLVPLQFPILVREAVATVEEIEPDEVESVPLVYEYNYSGQYWVEPETGILLNTIKLEHRTVRFDDDVMDAIEESLEETAALLESIGSSVDEITGLFPVTVSEYEYSFKPESTEDAKQEAQEAIDDINLYGTTIPIILIVVGLVMEVVAMFVLRQGKKETE